MCIILHIRSILLASVQQNSNSKGCGCSCFSVQCVVQSKAYPNFATANSSIGDIGHTEAQLMRPIRAATQTGKQEPTDFFLYTTGNLLVDQNSQKTVRRIFSSSLTNTSSATTTTSTLLSTPWQLPLSGGSQAK